MNWATLAPRRLRILPENNGELEMVPCAKGGKLTLPACVERWKRGNTEDIHKEGSLFKEPYEYCRGCDTGQARMEGRDPSEVPMKRKYQNRPCKKCQKDFPPKSSTDFYCSDECRPPKGQRKPGHAQGAKQVNLKQRYVRQPLPSEGAKVSTVDNTASAADVLRISGFEVEVVRVPSGSLIKVS